METEEQYIKRLRKSISALGGQGMGSRAKECEMLLTELFPHCRCARILSQCLPVDEEPIVRRGMFLVRMFTSLWFEEKGTMESVQQEFIQYGFIPIASFNGGVLGLHKHDGYIELGDSVAVFAEYGYNAFDEEHIWSLDHDIAVVLGHVVERINAGSPGSIDHILLSINKKP